MSISRPTWDSTFFDLAVAMEKRTKCVKAQVGAVIVSSDNRVISTGYNGPAAKLTLEVSVPSRLKYIPPTIYKEPVGDRTCDQWCSRAMNGSDSPSYGLGCPSIHAEANALLRADWSQIQDGTIYITRSSCADCAKLISNSGIAHVVHRVTEADMHRNPDAVEKYLRDCGLTVVRHD